MMDVMKGMKNNRQFKFGKNGKPAAILLPIVLLMTSFAVIFAVLFAARFAVVVLSL